MGKAARKPSSAPGSQAKARTGDLVKFDPDRVKEFLDAAKLSHPDAEKIIDGITAGIAQHGDFFSWMGAVLDARKLHEAFPVTADQRLIDSSWPTGLNTAQLWMFGTMPEDGFSEVNVLYPPTNKVLQSFW